VVVEPVEATIARLFPQRAFRCFDRLSNHKLNDRVSAYRTFWWLSLSKPPLAFSHIVPFDWLWEHRLADDKLNDRVSACRTFRWLSQSKPPFSLAFFHSRFDASTSSATADSTTVPTSINDDFI